MQSRPQLPVPLAYWVLARDNADSHLPELKERERDRVVWSATEEGRAARTLTVTSDGGDPCGIVLRSFLYRGAIERDVVDTTEVV